MRIILLQPPQKTKKINGPPLGLAYVAACLEKNGHKVRIIDTAALGYKLSDIKKEITKFNPEIIGISSTTKDIYKVFSIFKMSKENNPNCINVLGGPHSTIRSIETLNECNDIDIIVRGEGEETFVELLEKKDQLEKVKGITYRINKKIKKNPDRSFISNLDKLPFPAYHLLPMKKYKIKFNLFEYTSIRALGAGFGAISTCRGCIYDCAFCSSKSLWGQKWRARSPENVIEELSILRDKYNIRIIDFVDDTFTINKKRTEKICNLIKKEDIDISWICPTRADLFTKEISQTLKKGKCSSIFFGLESGEQKTLDFLNKGITIEQARQAVKNAKQSGFKIFSGFIIGVPGETKQSCNKTILFAKKLKLDVASFSLLIPFPGTKIFEIAEKNNLLLSEDWSKYTGSYPLLKLKKINSNELKNLLFKAYLTFNFPIKNFLKSVKNIN